MLERRACFFFDFGGRRSLIQVHCIDSSNMDSYIHDTPFSLNVLAYLPQAFAKKWQVIAKKWQGKGKEK